MNKYINISMDGDSVRLAKIEDVKYIISLANKESNSVGFIPKMAYEAAITGIKTGKRWSNVCNDMLWVCENNNDLVGFVLASFGNFRSDSQRGKIAQICIQEDARKIQRGKYLLDAVLFHAIKIGCLNFGCGCADDLESNIFWQAMGWELVGTRKGIGHKNTWVQTSKRTINIYYKDDPTQLKLF